MEVLPWLSQQEDALAKTFDANDFLYQADAYTGTTSERRQALAAIRRRPSPRSRRRRSSWLGPRICSIPISSEGCGERDRQRQSRDDQPRHDAGSRLCRRRLPRGCGVSQPRGRRLSRRPNWRKDAAIAPNCGDRLGGTKKDIMTSDTNLTASAVCFASGLRSRFRSIRPMFAGARSGGSSARGGGDHPRARHAAAQI